MVLVNLSVNIYGGKYEISYVFLMIHAKQVKNLWVPVDLLSKTEPKIKLKLNYLSLRNVRRMGKYSLWLKLNLFFSDQIVCALEDNETNVLEISCGFGNNPGNQFCRNILIVFVL